MVRPAGLPKSIEEVWRKNWIVIIIWCIYVCPLYMRCSMPVLFICAYNSVNLPIVKGGYKCEIWIVGQTKSCWVGQDKYRRYNMEESWQEAQSNPRTRLGWTYLRDATRNSYSSMNKVYDKCNSYEKGRFGCCGLPVQCFVHA